MQILWLMRTRDPELVWDMLRKQVRRTQSNICRFSLEQFNLIMLGFESENSSLLGKSNKSLKNVKTMLKKTRKQQLLVLQRIPYNIAIERNTWFHLGMNNNQQYIYTLRRMLEPIKEHVDNSFNPLSSELINEFMPVRNTINELMKATCEQIETGRYDNYRQILADADTCKDNLSVLRKKHIDRMQQSSDNSLM